MYAVCYLADLFALIEKNMREIKMSSEINEDGLTQIKELMGDKFPGLVETYLRSGREHVSKIKQGFETGDAKAIVDSAHPMKSASGNMGLAGLSTSAAQLEADAKDVVAGGQNIESLEALIVKVEEQFSRGAEFLKS